MNKATKPEVCDESCVHWGKCKRKDNCPVFQQSRVKKSSEKPLFPSEEELDRAVENEMRAGGEL